MRGKKYYLGLLLLFFVCLAGCGGGGAPGSSGSENTGIIIKSVSISDAGTTEGATGKEVDVALHSCDPDPEPGLFIHSQTLNISADKLNPSAASDPFPASVEQCTITYIKANSDPASPVIETMTVYPNCTLTAGDDNACIISLMDLQRKRDFWSSLPASINPGGPFYFNAPPGTGINIPAEFPTHYIAQVRCKYMSNYGSSGYFQVEYDIWLADWDLC